MLLFLFLYLFLSFYLVIETEEYTSKNTNAFMYNVRDTVVFLLWPGDSYYKENIFLTKFPRPSNAFSIYCTNLYRFRDGPSNQITIESPSTPLNICQRIVLHSLHAFDDSVR